MINMKHLRLCVEFRIINIKTRGIGYNSYVCLNTIVASRIIYDDMLYHAWSTLREEMD